MKLKTVQRLAVALAAAFFVIILPACKQKIKTSTDPAFAQYISAFTSGTVSTAGTIRVRLADQFVEQVELNKALTAEYLEFSPSIEGELVWIDNQTLEFRPKEWLPRGQAYQAELHLDQLTSVPEALKTFFFGFTVINQNIDVEIQKVSTYSNEDLRSMYISGVVRTLDIENNAELEKVIEAKEGSQDLKVSWTHTDDEHLHYFTVDSIVRNDDYNEVVVSWDGSPVNCDVKGEYKQEIPSLRDFKVIFTNVVQQPEQYIVLQFSDPLLPNQNLEGLLELAGYSDCRMTLEGNEIRIYPPYRLTGSATVLLHPGVKNILGYANQQEISFEFTFEELKPAVEMIDETKNILPSTEGMVFAFKAVNLSAVDVKVIRIFENNVAQFLQVNDLNGDQEMKRVGRQVAKKTVNLSEVQGKNLAQWNTFFLDLDDIIKAEPGAIYRIEIGFKRSYSLYHCDGTSTEEEENDGMTSTEDEADAENEFSYWDFYEDYGYDEYYEDYYDWNNQDNPCDPAYYKNRKAVGKNILASNIGIITKSGNDRSMRFFVSDLRTTEPLSGVTLEVLNFQQQVLASVTTDSKGEAQLEKVDGVPFLLVAKKDKQRGYLKLDGGHALSLSTFDVTGTATEKGLKGFIYGERGVWRPGDSLFVSFMLEDKQKTLPENHPVQFELINPRGQVVQKMVKSKGENGFYRFTCKTDADAETGNYQANVRVGGATFSKNIKVETIKPNRLKLALDFGKEKITALDQSLSGKLSAKWLHGATAKNLKANITATFSRTTTVFDRYKDYYFDDPTTSFVPEEQVIFDGQINAQGEANVGMNIQLDGIAPGMVNANFNVKVFEEGGDFSVDRFSIPYAPYTHFVGLKLPKGDAERGMLLTDTDHKVEVMTVDANGKPAKRSNLTWKVYKVQWRWWWEKNSDDFVNFVGDESATPIAEGSFGSGTDGRGSFKFQVKYPDWGRYLVQIQDTESGHTAGKTVYVDWPGWAGRAQTENPGGASMLVVNTNKDKFNLGEECTVTFPSSGIGRALISIENGTRVLETHWVKTSKPTTSFTFKTKENMTPNAYVNVTLVQPHNQTANDMPIRLYGVTPLFVENPSSHLNPVITMKNELEPEKTFDVTVSEKSGKAMTYTLAIVDEGLLDLTRFKTPDPWNYFYAREALGVNTFDMYDQVIGAYGSKLEKLLSVGGSDEGNGKAKNRANRFKPVVIYAGPFTVNAGQSKKHTFDMPNYVGAVRVMVVAGKDLAYGNAEKSVPVKKPLMVLATLPRTLSPGEEVKLPVNVFAMDKNIKDVKVTVEPNELLKLQGNGTQSIRFTEPGDQVVNYGLKVAEKEGVGKVKVTVSSGNFKSTYEIEIDVRNPNAFNTDIIQSVVDAGQTWKTPFDLIGMAGTQTAVLELSGLPPVDFGRRLKYLLEYPHGCIEQTTSGAFPQLYLADVIDMSDKEKVKAAENIKAAINRLNKFQTKNGGLSYWPGETQEDEWGSTYAGHFMLEAKAKGYTLPSGFESKWVEYQKRSALNWRPMAANSGNIYWQMSDLNQAYRLYTLALAGKAEMGAMNRLKEQPNLSIAAKWRLAAAYVLAGQKTTAQTLVKSLSTVIAPYTDLDYTYGTEWRDEAMIIETLALLDDRAKAGKLVQELSKKLSSPDWCSTQTTAYGLLAISKYAGGQQGKNVKFVYTLNGKTAAEKTSQRPYVSEVLSAKSSGNNLSVKNTSTGVMYARLILRGKPTIGNETPSANGLIIKVDYTDIKGNSIDVGRLEQGTDFYANVTVAHNGLGPKYDELALTEMFPSGWEIINSRMETNAGAMKSDVATYQDIRDDRVNYYFDLVQKTSVTYRMKLTAAYLGRFYLAGVNCEAMYDSSINARTKGRWIEVVNGSSLASK